MPCCCISCILLSCLLFLQGLLLFLSCISCIQIHSWTALFVQLVFLPFYMYFEILFNSFKGILYFGFEIFKHSYFFSSGSIVQCPFSIDCAYFIPQRYANEDSTFANSTISSISLSNINFLSIFYPFDNLINFFLLI